MNKLLCQTKVFFKRNSSTILTCVGAAGVVGTAVMAVKATPKALRLIEMAEAEKGEELTKVEVVKTAAPVYIPTVLVGASTIACIFGANVLNKRQQASLMSSYALLDNTYKKYKDKVDELYGEEVNTKIKNEISKDIYKENNVVKKEDDKKLFFDYHSLQYFESTMIDVMKAEKELNKMLGLITCVSLNEFYDMLGIDRIHGGDDIGWSSNRNFMDAWQPGVDLKYTNSNMEDGMECTIIEFSIEPYMDYLDY